MQLFLLSYNLCFMARGEGPQGDILHVLYSTVVFSLGQSFHRSKLRAVQPMPEANSGNTTTSNFMFPVPCSVTYASALEAASCLSKQGTVVNRVSLSLLTFSYYYHDTVHFSVT